MPVAKIQFQKILNSSKPICGIYKITNVQTKECYIGQSTDVKKRWYEHCRCGCGIDTPQNNKLYIAMSKYGLHNFTFELLEQCKSNELNKKEKYYIELYQSTIVGYNSQGGKSG